MNSSEIIRPEIATLINTIESVAEILDDLAFSHDGNYYANQDERLRIANVLSKVNCGVSVLAGQNGLSEVGHLKFYPSARKGKRLTKKEAIVQIVHLCDKAAAEYLRSIADDLEAGHD